MAVSDKVRDNICSECLEGTEMSDCPLTQEEQENCIRFKKEEI